MAVIHFYKLVLCLAIEYIVVGTSEVTGSTYEVKVTTHDSLWAGTDARVFVRVFGTQGSTAEHELTCTGSDDCFERGRTDSFRFDDLKTIGKFVKLEVRRDDRGSFAGWKLAKISVKSTNSLKMGVFIYNDWISERKISIQVHCGAGYQRTSVTRACEGPICGQRPSPRGGGRLRRMIDGSEAVRGSWPWQVMLRFNVYDRAFFCGGSLVFPQWVLTSAYCVFGKDPAIINARLGAHYKHSDTGSEQEIPVQKVFIHPKYHNPVLFANDVALLKLARPATLTQAVSLVCLPTNHIAAPRINSTKTCWFTGWGMTSSKPVSWANGLQEAQINVASMSKCNALYSARKTHKSMVCGGVATGDTEPCQKDEGGP